MREPSARTSRLAIAAGVAAVIAVGGGGFLLGRATAPQVEAPSAPRIIVPPPVTPLPPLPPLPRLWGRAEILDLAARAADATASASPLPADVGNAVGQRFDIALPFGCAGPRPEDSSASMRWHYDEVSGVLRIRAMPTSWQPQDWALPEDAGEADGFWIDRPWSTADSCPARSEDAAAPPAAGPDPVLALAQFGSAAASDMRAKDRPFEKTLRVAPEELDASRGFRLRLIGRISGVPGGGPVHCTQAKGVEQRPTCLIAMTLTEVRLENPAHTAPLAIWESRGSLP